MNSSEYSYLVSKRLKNAVEVAGITQSELRDRCKEYGLDLSQPSLSRLLSGGDKLDIYKVAIVSKVLELQLDEVLSFGPDETIKASKKAKDPSFITDVTNQKFKCYLGHYFGYFYSTVDKETIHFGDFNFYADSTGQCRVSFEFETGEYDINNQKVVKKYDGTAKLSDTMGAICCEMTSQDNSGDVSYIIFKYDYIVNQLCECRIGMVVTICAGLKRLPVAHKLLICRQKLLVSDFPFIEGQLKLNDDTIFVSESDYYTFINDPLLPESFQHYVKNENDLFIKNAANLSYYSFREEDVLNNKGLSTEDKIKVINLLRKYSSAKSCKKIGPKSEIYVFKYLMSKKKESQTPET